MARAQHYYIDCETHFGGPPNHVTPTEHVDIAHDCGIAQIVVDGNWTEK